MESSIHPRQPVDIYRVVQRIFVGKHLELPHQNRSPPPFVGQRAAETFQITDVPQRVFAVVEEDYPVGITLLNSFAYCQIKIGLPHGGVDLHGVPIFGVSSRLAAIQIPCILVVGIDKFFDLCHCFIPGLFEFPESQIVDIHSGEP